MSPAAAEFASACRAPGPPDDVVVGAGPRFVEPGAEPVAGAALWLEPPQPAGAAASSSMIGRTARRDMSSVSEQQPEPRLNARLVPRHRHAQAASSSAPNGERSFATTVVTGIPRWATRLGKSTCNQR